MADPLLPYLTLSDLITLSLPLLPQATTGSGGWPMSVFLTPSLEPVYGGTYYPLQDIVQGTHVRSGLVLKSGARRHAATGVPLCAPRFTACAVACVPRDDWWGCTALAPAALAFKSAAGLPQYSLCAGAARINNLRCCIVSCRALPLLQLCLSAQAAHCRFCLVANQLRPVRPTARLGPTGGQMLRPSFKTVLRRLSDLWSGGRREELRQQGASVMAQLQEAVAPLPPEQESPADSIAAAAAEGLSRRRALGAAQADAAIAACARSLEGRYDSVHGGFGGAPKFPRPSEINLLLRYASEICTGRCFHGVYVEHACLNMRVEHASVCNTCAK